MMSIFRRRRKTKFKLPPTEENPYSVFDVETIPDSGIVRELDSTEWMASEDVINEIDPSRVKCWLCFKYIDKKDCVSPRQHMCADGEQCKRNQQMPKVSIE